MKWLDLTHSTYRTVSDVTTQFGVGGNFEGFRYATRDEIETLWNNAGIGVDTGATSVNFTPATNLLTDFLGITQPFCCGLELEGYNGEELIIAGQPSANFFVPLIRTYNATSLTPPPFTAEATTMTVSLDNALLGRGHWLVKTDPVTVELIAEVRTIFDAGAFLGGNINVGDLVVGTYTYDSTVPDSESSTIIGSFNHSNTPFGISLKVEGEKFRTDPDNVVFQVQINNDDQGRDLFF